MDRRLAEVALGLAEGVARNDAAAESLLVDAFDSVEQAAHAHAYLAGFLLVLLAEERNEGVSDCGLYVRSMLRGEGPGSGIRSL
jgi:hypothetical protein